MIRTLFQENFLLNLLGYKTIRNFRAQELYTAGKNIAPNIAIARLRNAAGSLALRPDPKQAFRNDFVFCGAAVSARTCANASPPNKKQKQQIAIAA